LSAALRSESDALGVVTLRFHATPERATRRKRHLGVRERGRVAAARVRGVGFRVGGHWRLSVGHHTDRADELSGRALRITSVPALLQRVIFIVFMFNTSLHRTGALA
jgi:hypothetical protein